MNKRLLVITILVVIVCWFEYVNRRVIAHPHIPLLHILAENVAVNKPVEIVEATNVPPTVAVDTPSTVKPVFVAMVPPPVREAVDATARVETLPQAEDYEAMMSPKTFAATLRALAGDPAANTVLRLSARHSLSDLSE